jgi:phosphatidylglycerol:prolipoprotein diacylglycerol transferase
MYAAVLMLSATPAAGTLGMPYFHLGSIGPIQWFGVLVAVGVLIGAAILRRYAEWHGVSDDHIRGLTGWITLTGFIGAHVFDVIAYQGDKAWFATTGDGINVLWPTHWPLILQLWAGISSYGGFLGGAMGFAFYVWWKRLPPRLMADVGIVGLIPAFSIGRIGCTVVSDHIGAAVDPHAWYAFLAMDYPRDAGLEVVHNLAATHPGTGAIAAWNLGFIELLYLIPVNALILWLAFRPRKPLPAGFLAVVAGVVYAPVRFFLDYLRPENSDPRHFGLTFAQWASFLAFGAAVYFATRLLKNGKPAETIAPTSLEAQVRLNSLHKEEDGKAPVKAPKFTPKPKAEKVVEQPVKAAAEPDPEPTEAELEAEQEAKEAVARARAKAEELAESTKKKKRRKDGDKTADAASSDASGANKKPAAGDIGTTKPKNT